MARILITGGSGFVALHAAEVAIARGHDVILFDLAPPPAYAAALAPTARAVQGDVLDRAALARAADGATHVIHCAAVVGPVPAKADPARAVAVNVMGTTNVLELARARAMPVVNLSTATLYGHRPGLEPLDEAAPPDPIGVYDATKLMAETLCATYRKTFAVAVASIRTGFVFGHGSRIGEYFLPRVLRGEAIDEPCGAAHSCDFTYVVDLARGLVAAAEAGALREPVYNVTTGVRRTRGDLAAAVRALVPGAVIRQGPGIDPARHLRGACLIARAARDFGYAPQFTLETGLAHWRARIAALGDAS